MDEVYTSIVADIAKLARKLAKTESYETASGHVALVGFADHLEGIVAAVGVQPSKNTRGSPRKSRTTSGSRLPKIN